MLRMPLHTSPTVSMVGIDPGSMTLGISILRFDVETLEITSTSAMTLTGAKYIKDDYRVELYGERTARINAIGARIAQILYEAQPFMVASEVPFYNPRRPGAYGPLVEVVAMVKQVVMEYHPMMPLHFIEPAVVKKNVKARTDISDKNDVKRCVLALPDLRYNGHIPLDQLDDNAIDALAVVYGQFYKYKREVCLVK